MVHSVTPFLWFNNDLEQAIALYSSIFKNFRTHNINRMDGRVFGAEFEIEGQKFNALNGGPTYAFTEAISLFVSVDDQAEVDRIWDALCADGGAPGRCGWLKDKFGLSWQIIPTALGRLMGDPKVVQAMMQMNKIIISDLEKAHAG